MTGQRRALIGNLIFGLFIAAGVAYLLYRTDPATWMPGHWATVEELHARWSLETNSTQISVKGKIRESCRRTVVVKDARLIEDDVATAEPIPLAGTLASQLQDHAAGDFLVFDHARPSKGTLMPGHYLLTLVLVCEMNGGVDQALASEPARAVFVVEKIRVRPVTRLEGAPPGRAARSERRAMMTHGHAQSKRP